MKKIISIIAISLILPILQFSNANADENAVAVGGFAIVNPETGVVHGVIVGSIEYFGGNDKTMESEFMGCPVGCLIIQQSTSDQNGNVAGIHGPNVTYNQDRNVFQSVEANTVQTEIITSPVLSTYVVETITSSVSNTSITETVTSSVLNTSVTETVTSSVLNTSVTETVTSVLNTYVIETGVSVYRSKIYEFGVQDLTNTNGAFQVNEIAPPQNTSAQVSVTTKEFICENSSTTCSKNISNTSNTLSEETTLFNERKTSQQVLEQVVTEAKTKIIEQINIILFMLSAWIVN